MEVYIPVADVTLTNGGTYDGQLPIWSTRPLMITCKPDFISSVGYDLHIDVISGGARVKSISFPFSVSIDVDAAFAAWLLPRADRNKSQYIPECWLRVWSQSVESYIKIPVFHADLTYWHTLGNQSSLPQPAKPRIPGQTLDIFYPKRTQQQAADAYNVVAEPVTGYPSTVIFPTKYILGKTIDISYIKKLTIKDYPSAGLTYDINYEDRLPSSAVDDASLQCALRARWNMQNGQWFWAAFKDYYWTNKFTTIRGRGGVTDQATVTVNLEYGREWYTVYQQLLTSSNIMFDLMIDGINQYSDKQFRAEVVGDTGARWNNASKLYRQQVQFRTTELQDNYLFPNRPDTPETPAITFRAQFNPWSNGPDTNLDAWNNITSNADWYVESEPSWYAVTNGTELFRPDMFEQGSYANYSAGTHWSTWKTGSSANYVRMKEPIWTPTDVFSIIAAMGGYDIQIFYLDSAGIGVTASNWTSTNTGRINLSNQGFLVQFRKSPLSAITLADVNTIQARYGKRYWTGKAGVQYIEGYMLGNTSTSSRNGTLSLRSMAGAVSFDLPVIQDVASLSLDPESKKIGKNYLGGELLTIITCNSSWDSVDAPDWIFINPSIGNAGSSYVFTNIQENTGGATRTGTIKFRSRLNTDIYKTMTVIQAGQSDVVTVFPTTANALYVSLPQEITVKSFGDWSVSERPSWITPSRYDGPGGETTAVTLTIAAIIENNDPRTGVIKFYDHITNSVGTMTITQEGPPSSIVLLPFEVTGPASAGNVTKTLALTSAHNWMMDSGPSWVTITPTSGASGLFPIAIKYDTPNTGAARAGLLKIRNTTTGDIAVAIIRQEGV